MLQGICSCDWCLREGQVLFHNQRWVGTDAAGYTRKIVTAGSDLICCACHKHYMLHTEQRTSETEER